MHMEANAVLRCRLFELRDRLKAETRKATGRSQRICSDEAISEMSVIRPRRISDFGLIQGLGKIFVRNYAKEFLSVIDAYSAETDTGDEEVRMREEVECSLQELEKKLVNISRGNRLLFMPRATNSKEAFDLVQLTDCDPLSVLSDRSAKVRIASASSRTADGKKADFHGRLSQLYRNINRIAREKGHNDLYIGYPFVEGCLPGERFDVRAPLALFPVEMFRTQDAICIRYDDSRDAVFNNNLILGYFKMNGITRPLPDNVLGEVGAGDVIERVTEFYEAAGLAISDDGEKGPVRFENFRTGAFPEYGCGELHIVRNMVLGRFPTYSSSIQKDFIDIVGKHMANPILDELLSSASAEIPDIEPRDIPEADLTYINDLNASQEQVLDAVRRYDRLVIQGPPGTGKSQTITSIIADQVSSGKTVLMVSEKKAALDVVRSRLGDLSKYCILIDDVNGKQSFYAQMDSITSIEPPSEGSVAESPEEISREIQSRFDVLDAIERTIYDTDHPGSEPYSLYVSGRRPDPSDKAELRRYNEFRGIFSKRILDYGMPEIYDAHCRFGRRSLMTDIGDCLEMRAQHPWMMDLRPDLTDYDIEQARTDLTDLRKEIVQWKNSGFFTKMMGKPKMKARIEEVMSRYWTFYRCTEPASTEYELDEYLNGLAHYDEFATVNNIYESLPESSKLYVEMMRRGEEEEICSPNLINDRLYSFASLQYLQKFENENKAVLRDIEMFDSLISEVNELVRRKELAVRGSLDRKLSSYLDAIRTSKRFPEMRRAIEMKRRWSVNKFVGKFDYELFGGIRVWLLTPDVVSEILPLEPGLFDLVIFDEASQMFMEKGVPSVMRAKKVVIAGDHMQLRPSRLGSGRIGMDEDDAEDDQIPAAQESDSLLDAARSRYPSVMLRYHYRSRYEELIQFSNRAFYGGRLCVSPNLTPGTEPPIQVHRVEDGRWADRCNVPEGRRVVDLISDILRTKGDETVGIITFNSAQMDLIDSLLEDRCSADPEFAELYRSEVKRRENGEDVGLFVRNIENVQGDERDIIVFSVGYAKGENGKLVRNFGWLNQYGGENRLNVAITRARRKIHIVSSFDPSELEVDDMKNRGPKLLKMYLQYCSAVSSGDRMAVESTLRALDRTRPTEGGSEDDRFADAVFESLRSKGLDVVRDVGAGGYGVDIAVRKDGRFVLGIECDGRRYHSTMSTRERDWHRRRYLESRGWNVTRAWCADWWRDPEAAADGIADEIASL